MITIISITKDPSYLGDMATEKDGITWANNAKTAIDNFVKTEYPDSDFQSRIVPEVQSVSNQSIGDFDILDDVEIFIEHNWTEWMPS